MKLLNQKMKKTSVIEKLKNKLNDDFYILENTYNGCHSKIEIICKKCNKNFFKTPNQLIFKTKIENICPHCKNKRCLKSNYENFLLKAKEIHGNKYDYSKVEYINSKTKVCIICPEHGEFYQEPNSHLQGHGCPFCKSELKRNTTKGFIEKANEIHNNFYDYSLTKYGSNRQEKVIIKCPLHGEFTISPKSHLRGSGCPKCKQSSLEKDVKCFLIENNLNFEQEKTFEWLKNEHHHLFLDFYLPEHNIAIECQGEQHFKPIKYYGGVNKFHTLFKNDLLKKSLCDKHNIKIIHKTNTKNCSQKIYKKWNFYKLYFNNNEILKQIIYEK